MFFCRYRFYFKVSATIWTPNGRDSIDCNTNVANKTRLWLLVVIFSIRYAVRFVFTLKHPFRLLIWDLFSCRHLLLPIPIYISMHVVAIQFLVPYRDMKKEHGKSAPCRFLFHINSRRTCVLGKFHLILFSYFSIFILPSCFFLNCWEWTL